MHKAHGRYAKQGMPNRVEMVILREGQKTQEQE